MKSDTSDIFQNEPSDAVKEITPKQYAHAAEQLMTEFKRRQNLSERKVIEEHWKEVDRQVALKPMEKDRESWHPLFELPGQADALEIIASDINQLLFPGNTEFFNVHAQMTDDYLADIQADIDYLNSGNPEAAVFNATQTDLDAVNQAALIHAMRQYNFQDRLMQVISGGIKYGTWVGRLRAVSRVTYMNEFHGVLRSSAVMPVLSPICIKYCFPDDLAVKAQSHGLYVAPTEMICGQQRISDIKVAAATGKKDTTDNEIGGWLKDEVGKTEIKPGADNMINFFEAEGDLVIPVSQGKDIIARNMIVTVAYGDNIGHPRIIRIRENPYSFNSIFWGNYFKDTDGVYGTSPLVKGVALQKMAQEAAEDVMITSARIAKPPIKVNRNDPAFRRDGNYDLSPGAQVDALTPPEPIVIGDIGGSVAVYSAMQEQYQQTTGVSPLRAGAQTKSHQTTFAVDLEDQRGQSRTVSFVRAFERGPMDGFLHAQAEILRKNMTNQDVYVPGLGAYVKMSRKSLAPSMTFSVLGSSAPLERQQKAEKMVQAVQAVMQLEEIAQQNGDKPLNTQKIREEMLKAGFPATDIDQFFGEKPAPQVPQVAPAPQGQPTEVRQAMPVAAVPGVGI